MGTSLSHINETKKNCPALQDTTIRQKGQIVPATSEKKESQQPDLKQEYERLERYIQKFSGSSF